MIPITAIYPRPRPVVAAGQTFLVNEVRVCDLVELQSYIDGRATRPLEALRDELGRLDVPEAKDRLWGVLDELENDPPMWGNEAGHRFFGDWDGIVFWMGVILAQCQTMTPAILEWTSRRTTVPQWEAMKREWRRIEPAQEVESILGIEGESGEPVPWPQAVAEVVAMTGWTLDVIERLHMSQIRAIRTGGKKEERGVRVMPGTGMLKVVQAEMRARNGKLRGE